jgi:fumarate hydratase subunit beta
VSARSLTTPLTDAAVAELRSGDQVVISGVLYVARDAAHRRMSEAAARGGSLPFDPHGQIVYYMGPSPARPGRALGSAGPTSSYRMDPYTEVLLSLGMKAMIGKGERSQEVRDLLRKYRAVYLGAVGGTGALLSRCIKEADVIAYDDLGPEAVRRLVVDDFPAIVVNDVYGGDEYEQGKKEYQTEQAINH